VRISGFNWACICRYEVESVAAPLMILSVKLVGLSIREYFFVPLQDGQKLKDDNIVNNAWSNNYSFYCCTAIRFK